MTSFSLNTCNVIPKFWLLLPLKEHVTLAEDRNYYMYLQSAQCVYIWNCKHQRMMVCFWIFRKAGFLMIKKIENSKQDEKCLDKIFSDPRVK